MKSSLHKNGLHSGLREILPRWRRTALWAAIATQAGLVSGYAGVTVSPDIAYHFSAGRGEGLSVSHDGHRIMVSSPTDISASLGQPAETTFQSSIPFVKHTPRPSNPFDETASLDIGLIEAADVAVLHTSQYGLVAVRANRIPQPPPALPLVPPTGALLAVNGDQILQTLPIAGRPDGVKASPDGHYAVVAVEGGGDILVYDLSGGAGQIQLAARIARATLQTFYIGVPNPTGDFIEPESIGFAPDSSFALVTIQDCSSIAAIDLKTVTRRLRENALRRWLNRWHLPWIPNSHLAEWTPEQIGDMALKNVVHLPHGFRNNVNTGTTPRVRGVEPDGIAVSPDGSFAITANETHQSAKHLQGLSVLDLRGGLEAITAQTYSIFDIDPTLLNGTGLTAVPPWSTDTYPTDATKLPRLDPTNIDIVKRNNQTVAALVIERYGPSAAQMAAPGDDETRGSVLFLEVSEVLDGVFEVIQRVPVGDSGSTLEGVDTAQHGRWIFISISNGGGTKGTFARLELKN